jgi:segregation and condensation protein A
MSSSDADYEVNLDTFRGPMDLLLYLVKRDEIDIRDFPIARVIDQFKDYLDVVHMIDVERAGDFLVMSGTLMEIKSRLLLPRSEETASVEEDPRMGLVRQLMEYKRLKEASALLEAQAEEQSQRLTRQPPPVASPTSAPALRPVELWDLVSAFGRLMRETLALQPQQIVLDYTPIHIYMDQIVQRLEKEHRLPFSALFTPPLSRGRLVGLFLAVLELTKGHQVLPEQPDPFGEIWLVRPEVKPEPNGTTTDSPPPVA